MQEHGKAVYAEKMWPSRKVFKSFFAWWELLKIFIDFGLWSPMEIEYINTQPITFTLAKSEG